MQKSKNKKIPVHFTPASEWYDVQVSSGKNPKDPKFYEDCEDVVNLRKIGGVFVNDHFMPLLKDRNGLMFLAGGYGSSKTTYAITVLLETCMNSVYFKCFYGRQKKTEARQLHSNIITEIKRNNWEEFFEYSEKPTGSPRITCTLNGNSFELFGCDDVASLKGLNNPTHILIDEINQIDFDAFGMLFTRLRTAGHDSQLIGCFNNCDVYSDHWLRLYIYPESLPSIEVDKGEEEESEIVTELKNIRIVKHHSKYTDNYFLDKEKYYSQLVIQSGDNKERLKSYCDGDWGVSLEAQPFYKSFNPNLHVFDSHECCYVPRLPLCFSFDENVNPYLPVLIIQKEGNEIRLIDEITAKNPHNEITWVCEEILRKYPSHTAGFEIFGDATSKTKADVKLEKKANLYTIILDALKRYFPVLKVPESNPNSRMRGDFANLIFGKNYQGIVVKVSKKCVKTIEDFIYVQEDPDPKKAGSKHKPKSMVDGVRGVQKYGHLSDCFDYYLCEEFMWAFLMFQNGEVGYDPVGWSRNINNGIQDDPQLKIVKDIYTEINDGIEVDDDDEEYNDMFFINRDSRNRMD